MSRLSLLERLEKHSMPVPECGCWIWTGAQGRRGYGHIGINGKCVRAHRLSWELHYGPIPDGLHVLHKCDTPPCINPEHLFVGTVSDNAQDMVRKGRNPDYRGTKAPLAKLTEADVRTIRLSRAYPTQLSREYGVSLTAIKKILSGRTWAHVL